ncbi:MAG: YgiT-type zinc finger protein [Anaerolineae bacterium]|nr:YgiT-type zinc finger protein [Anaerolineae bacterium]
MNICPSCHVGRLQRRIMVYLQWHDDTLLIANRMPAVVCDVCGDRIYDHDAVESLQQLLWSYPPPPARTISSSNT